MTDQGVPAPPGWYPDGVNGQRYWDGSKWTDHRAPNAPTPGRLNGASVAGFVLALIGFLLTPIPFFVGLIIGGIPALVGAILSIVGLVGQNKRGDLLATFGFILGMLAVVAVFFGAGTIW